MPTPTFFKTRVEFRAWFAKHAATDSELIVGFSKRDLGTPASRGLSRWTRRCVRAGLTAERAFR
nr:hypothetical protein [Rhodoferax sp.]